MKEKCNDKLRSYATVNDDGVNYRDIAGTMSILGYPMNHSSARNHILRIMRKFVIEFLARWEMRNIDDVKLDEIARSAMFQNGIADVLRSIWDGPDRAQLFTNDAHSEKATEDHASESAATSQHDAQAMDR